MKLFAARKMCPYVASNHPFAKTRVAASLGKALLAVGCVSMGSLALLVFTTAASSTIASAKDGPQLSPSGEGGSDPSVGTLPSMGDQDFDFPDQTVTLRGSVDALRAAVVSANGVGAVEAIDLGDDQLWIRYFGNVQLELNLAALADVEVSIFTGFQGDGLTYSIGQANGFGEARRIASGGSIPLDPLRLRLSGLLDDTLFVAGLHQSGARTMTSLDFSPVDGVVTIRQDL